MVGWCCSDVCMLLFKLVGVMTGSVVYIVYVTIIDVLLNHSLIVVECYVCLCLLCVVL